MLIKAGKCSEGKLKTEDLATFGQPKRAGLPLVGSDIGDAFGCHELNGALHQLDSSRTGNGVA